MNIKKFFLSLILAGTSAASFATSSLGYSDDCVFVLLVGALITFSFWENADRVYQFRIADNNLLVGVGTWSLIFGLAETLLVRLAFFGNHAQGVFDAAAVICIAFAMMLGALWGRMWLQTYEYTGY